MKMRLRYISHPRAQLTIIVVYLISLLSFFSVAYLFLIRSFSELIDMGQQAGLPQEHIYFQYVRMQITETTTNLAIALLVSGLLGTIFFVWFSHKLVGPIVGLVEYLKRYKQAVAESKTPNPVKFRKGDYFHELALAVNEALQASRAKGNSTDGAAVNRNDQ